MSGLIARKLTQKFYVNACRYAYATNQTDKPYWLARFPDGKPRSFEEIPVVEESFFQNIRKIQEVSMQHFKKYGYVSKEWMDDDTCVLHLYHFEDFFTVYFSDGMHPIRKSHRAMRQYREERGDLYDNVGLGAGEGKEWYDFRKVMMMGITERIIEPLKPSLEAVADDLVKMLHIKANEGDVEPLPWLFRWAFESAGVVTMNRRMGALCESGSEEADKMVEAAGITNEMIAMTETDWANYEKHYQNLVPAQDYMYSVCIKYVDQIASDPHAKCVLKTLLQNKTYSKKNAITMILDIFQGALQTVPLTVLMAMYNLARNPHVQKVAREELENLLPSADSKYFDPVNRNRDTPYLSGIMWESLRLTPPIIGNGRVIQDNLILGGFLVPKGTNCILHQQVACLLEENFEEPRKFKPERHPTEHQMGLDFIFGGRGRICFGKRFAISQMSLVLAKIMRNFEISYEGGEISMINRLHNEPEHPLYLTLKPLV